MSCRDQRIRNWSTVSLLGVVGKVREAEANQQQSMRRVIAISRSKIRASASLLAISGLARDKLFWFGLRPTVALAGSATVSSSKS
jgi:hypothetical protein